MALIELHHFENGKPFQINPDVIRTVHVRERVGRGNERVDCADVICTPAIDGHAQSFTVSETAATVRDLVNTIGGNIFDLTQELRDIRIILESTQRPAR